jgi:hypothetical protein
MPALQMLYCRREKSASNPRKKIPIKSAQKKIRVKSAQTNPRQICANKSASNLREKIPIKSARKNPPVLRDFFTKSGGRFHHLSPVFFLKNSRLNIEFSLIRGCGKSVKKIIHTSYPQC